MYETERFAEVGRSFKEVEQKCILNTVLIGLHHEFSFNFPSNPLIAMESNGMEWNFMLITINI